MLLIAGPKMEGLLNGGVLNFRDHCMTIKRPNRMHGQPFCLATELPQLSELGNYRQLSTRGLRGWEWAIHSMAHVSSISGASVNVLFVFII